MSDIVIRAESLGKKYKIRHQSERQRYVALRDVLAEKIRAPWRWLKSPSMNGQGHHVRPPSTEDFWALKDVSFEIKRGEIVGIIGRNGAGKSTLLKILGRITEPTEGRVRIKGRIASLLEVGTGFHPELTGRENIFLNGAILGMGNQEIKRKFDEIVAFADVEKFLDTPVKRYSSGMYVRLAFAVAAHLESEILVVDEVLAVGDLEFQKKCLGKMGEIANQESRTVLFVSHQMGMISKLCDVALMLREGRIVGNGPTAAVVQNFLVSAQDNNGNILIRTAQPNGAEGIWIAKAGTCNELSQTTDEFGHEQNVVLSIQCAREKQSEINIKRVIMTVALEDRWNRRVFTSELPFDRLDQRVISQDSISLKMTIRMPILVPGHYSFIITLHTYEGKIFDRLTKACEFAVRDTGSSLSKYEGVDHGCIFAPTDWEFCSDGYEMDILLQSQSA